MPESGRQPSLGLAKLLPADRRTAARYSVAADASEPPVLDEHGAPLTAEVLNISAGGIRMLISKRVEPGEILKLELPSKDQWGVMKLLARVLHVERHASGSWEVGCTFTRRLKDLELVAVL